MKLKQKKNLVSFWKEGARRSLELARHIMNKKYYDHALFFGHLALEKFLKVKNH